MQSQYCSLTKIYNCVQTAVNGQSYNITHSHNTGKTAVTILATLPSHNAGNVLHSHDTSNTVEKEWESHSAAAGGTITD